MQKGKILINNKQQMFREYRIINDEDKSLLINTGKLDELEKFLMF